MEILKKRCDLPFGKTCDLFHFKIVKSFTVSFSSFEDCNPTQPCLCQNQEFKQLFVSVNWNAPFSVMIFDVNGIGACPRTSVISRVTIRTNSVSSDFSQRCFVIDSIGNDLAQDKLVFRYREIILLEPMDVLPPPAPSLWSILYWVWAMWWDVGVCGMKL